MPPRPSSSSTSYAPTCRIPGEQRDGAEGADSVSVEGGGRSRSDRVPGPSVGEGCGAPGVVCRVISNGPEGGTSLWGVVVALRGFGERPRSTEHTDLTGRPARTFS